MIVQRKSKKGDVCFPAWRRLEGFKVTLKVSWRERKKNKKQKNRKAEHSGLAWCRTLGIQQRKAHKLLDWRQEPSVLSHPPGWRPLPSHTRPLSTSSPLYSARYRWEPHLSALAYFQHFSSSRSLSFSSPPLHPFLVLSQDALMSAHTCCHIPPVPSSARHDRIGLNWAAAGGAAKQLDKPGLIERGWKEAAPRLVLARRFGRFGRETSMFPQSFVLQF